MSVTPATFVAIHKEFEALNASDPTMVQTAIDDASSETDAEVCGDKTDRVVRLRAADALARSPFGQQAGLVDDEGKTPYQRSLEDLLDRIGRTAGLDV